MVRVSLFSFAMAALVPIAVDRLSLAVTESTSTIVGAVEGSKFDRYVRTVLLAVSSAHSIHCPP